MTEYLEALEDKRNKLNSDAEAHRKKRDRLNQETKQFAEKRDQLNAQVKKLLQEANRFKEKRDELNGKVRSEKAVRENLTKTYNDLKAQLDKVRKARAPSSDEISVSRLKKEVHTLEFKQMTSVMEADKERDLVERISQMKKQIESKEKELEGSEEMRELLTSVKDAKSKMDECHKKVNEYADLAQKEHDSMIERFNSSDKLRREADRAQEEFVESKMKADEEHRRHIEMIHLVHDFDKIAQSLRNLKRVQERKTTPGGGKAPTPSAPSGKMEAERIFEKFKRGEKLSTEDLMVLQKHGFL
jgi:uncharacterized coiled-coil DUF342 family protein